MSSTKIKIQHCLNECYFVYILLFHIMSQKANYNFRVLYLASTTNDRASPCWMTQTH